MARIFKQTYTKPLPEGAVIITRNGKQFAQFKDRRGRTQTAPVSADGKQIIREVGKYYIEYRDATGEPRKEPGFADKRATEQKAADLERQADRTRAGIIDQESLDLSEHLRRDISEHIEAYKTHLRATVVSPWHLSETGRRLRRITMECEFESLAAIEPTAVNEWIIAASAKGLAPRTINTYIGSLRTFVRWAITVGRMAADPLATVSKLDEKLDVRRQRRALTEEELERLLKAAQDRPLVEALVIRRGRRKGQPLAKLSPAFQEQLVQLGRERALIYKTLVLTGLRRGELASLKWGDLDLSEPQAWLTVQAKHAKNRKSESVPIRADLAAELRRWREDQADPDDGEFVFRVPSVLIHIFDRDLLAAGIAHLDEDGHIVKTDERGRTLDVHALRHTTATYLAKAGVAPRTAQAIMRHSDIRLTLGAYTDPQLLDQAAAVNALPKLSAEQSTLESRAAGA